MKHKEKYKYPSIADSQLLGFPQYQRPCVRAFQGCMVTVQKFPESGSC